MPMLFENITAHTRPQYNPRWKHLDREQVDMDLRAKVVFGKLRIVPEDEGTRQHIKIVFSRPVTDKEAWQAAYDMFERGGCSHEYDCCGCWHGGADALAKRSRNRRKWVATLRFARNF